ncbi:MAG: hypothetical protein R3F22_05555 [Lysobacteraceae bacterium]
MLAESPGFEKAAERVEDVLGTMSEVFVDRDPLLSSQGPVTVYYQVCKAYGNHSGLRAAFNSFNKRREKNRSLIASGESGEQSLTSFDLMSRSTNGFFEHSDSDRNIDVLLKDTGLLEGNRHKKVTRVLFPAEALGQMSSGGHGN